MVEFVEPTLIYSGLQSDPGFTVFPDGGDQAITVDKIDHRNSHGRRLAGGLSEHAQGQQKTCSAPLVWTSCWNKTTTSQPMG